MNNNLVVPMLVLILMLGVLIFVMIMRGSKLGKNSLDKKAYQTAWLKIENGLSRDNPASYEVAVLGADKLFDRAMRESGFRGNTFAERIKAGASRFSKPELDGIWRAHKLRNRIAHETDANISYEQAKAALNGLKKGLKTLGAV